MKDIATQEVRSRHAIVTSADPAQRVRCMCPATESLSEDGETLTITVDLRHFPKSLRAGALIHLVDAQLNWGAFQKRQDARAYGALTYVTPDGCLTHIVGTLCPSEFSEYICLHSADGTHFSGITFAEMTGWRELHPPPERIIVDLNQPHPRTG